MASPYTALRPAAALPSAVLLLGQIGTLQCSLLPEEESVVAKAVEKRRREFTAGRTLARETLTVLNLPPAAIPQAPSRAPIWPDAVVGALTHTDHHVACAMAAKGDCHSVGIDMEKIGRVQSSLWGHLFQSAESERLRRYHPEEQARMATALFCAKEAYFKFQFPLTGTWLGFHDATVEIIHDSTFRITPRPGTAASLHAGSQSGAWSTPIPGIVLAELWQAARNRGSS